MSNDVFEKHKINFDELAPKILDSFVKVYGEKNRDVIKERMNYIYVNTYITKESFNSYNNSRSTKKQDELTLMFLEQIGEKLSDEEKSKVLREGSYNLTENYKKIMEASFNYSKFSEGSYTPISSFGKEIDENEDNEWRNKSILRDRCKVLNGLGLEITPENYNEIVGLESSKEILEKVDFMLKASNNCNLEYDKYKASVKADLDYIEGCSKLEETIKQEETIQLYKQLSPFLNEVDQKNITDAINLGDKTDLYRFKSIADKDGIYLDSLSMYGVGLVEYFSKECGETLNSTEKNKSYDISNIKNKRIKYFKNMGINLGDEYENYTQDEKAKQLVPNNELVEKVKEIRLEHIEKLSTRVLENTGTFTQNLNDIKKLDLLVSDSFDKDFVANNVICISPNLVNNNNQIEMKNIVHIPVFNMLPEYRDVMFIHEIGHAVEASFSKEDDVNVTFKTGFESFDDKIIDKNVVSTTQEKDDDNEKRKYELFSESIHQKIAMEITRDLHEKGEYIFNTPEDAKIAGGTSYEHYNVIVNEFYDKFKNDILDSRLEVNLDLLMKKVGKENFERFNESITEYSKLPYYSLMSDYCNKKDTELTQKAIGIIKGSRQTLKNMEDYSNKDKSDFEKETKGKIIEDSKVIEIDSQTIDNNVVSKDSIKNRKDHI
jgi:hypothetical protein